MIFEYKQVFFAQKFNYDKKVQNDLTIIKLNIYLQFN